ncbi:hypothetical protein NEOLEDRAFT_125512 [Neolentinus lepideus HHB14362 ss-1]|uniref:Uncharacterized protein n=1 Tax=Neolentinus lepideus HHB14362 ss-1 TaxID=1314782 RepID=A0A165MS33_9AGAM|nr:hypothetical protein NEOLEDRAFT_125512 [Neolentinus lepideus HHB14362 ss-1]
MIFFRTMLWYPTFEGQLSRMGFTLATVLKNGTGAMLWSLAPTCYTRFQRYTARVAHGQLLLDSRLSCTHHLHPDSSPNHTGNMGATQSSATQSSFWDAMAALSPNPPQDPGLYGHDGAYEYHARYDHDQYRFTVCTHGYYFMIILTTEGLT